MSLPDTLTLGAVALAVADLDRSVDFYTNALGMTELARDAKTVTLGAGQNPLIHLIEQVGAIQQPTRSTGLYHIAILLPSRVDLGHALLKVDRSGWPFQGFGDHFVSEAAYLADPDGNGLELYRDRPRDTWTWNGDMLNMGTAELDVRGIINEVRTPDPSWHMPAETVIGHMHLRVGDVAAGDVFYRSLLGFDLMVKIPSAYFFSAGGYHHHLGTNNWQSRGAGAPPADSVGLRWWTVNLPDSAAVSEIESRLTAAAVTTTPVKNGFEARDPWGIAVHVVTGE
jgi:catechol 2,3-dioxygenase